MKDKYIFKLSKGWFVFSKDLNNNISDVSIDTFEPCYREENSKGVRTLVVTHFTKGAGIIPINMIHRYIKNK